jgi:cell division protease FtsH
VANNDGKRGRWQGLDLGGGAPGGPRRLRSSPWVWAVAFILILITFQFLTSPRPNTIDYSNFLDRVQSGEIIGTLEISQTTVSGRYEDSTGEVDFNTTIPPILQGTSTLTDQLDAAGINYTGVTPNGLQTFLVGWVVPLLLFGFLWFFLVRRMSGAQAGAALNLGKNKVKIYDRKELKTTFADVAGVDEAKEELKEIVEFLRNPKKYQRLGGRIPKGVLLLGPPGCGKTLLARAVAGEANVPFFFMSGSEFVEMFVGLGAARVRELFQQAKEKAPALVFLDEIDTIGKGRAGALGAGFGANDEREQTLNQLLVEMDGFDSQKGVIIMAATNRPEVLDPALLRAGRFDRQVVVDKPDVKGREAILLVHARNVTLAPSVDLHVLAARTPGMAGADLANMINEAALLAARKGKDAVDMADLDEAVDRVIGGLERKSRVLSEKERDIVAHHEIGHALVASSLPQADPVHKVTIIPRGVGALGATYQLPLEDRYLLTKSELEDRIAVLLGGRVAEEVVYGEISTGAHNDLERATEMARLMITQYGMSEKLGPMTFGGGPQSMFLKGAGLSGDREFSDETALAIDNETRAIIDKIYDRVRDLVSTRKAVLMIAAAELKQRETLEGDRLRELLAGGPSGG